MQIVFSYHDSYGLKAMSQSPSSPGRYTLIFRSYSNNSNGDHILINDKLITAGQLAHNIELTHNVKNIDRVVIASSYSGLSRQHELSGRDLSWRAAVRSFAGQLSVQLQGIPIWGFITDIDAFCPLNLWARRNYAGLFPVEDVIRNFGLFVPGAGWHSIAFLNGSIRGLNGESRPTGDGNFAVDLNPASKVHLDKFPKALNPMWDWQALRRELRRGVSTA